MCLIDEAGTTLWSAKVVNDEGAILEAITAVLAQAELVSGQSMSPGPCPGCCWRCWQRTVSR